MGATFQEARPALEKLIGAIRRDPALLNLCQTPMPPAKGCLTVERLSDMAGNHSFDDFPGAFGLTEPEAHTVRSFFQSGGTQDYGAYTYIGELRVAFPGVFQPEREEYVRRINGDRRAMGLDPLPDQGFGLVPSGSVDC